MRYGQKRATMVNDSDVDSWRTESDSNVLDRRRIILIDRRARSGGTRENTTQITNTNFGPEIRYINPAIYTESVGEEEHDATRIHRPESDREQEECCNKDAIDVSHGDFNPSTIDLPSARKGATNNDRATEHPVGTGQSTYRCYSTSFPDTALSIEPSTARSTVSSGVTARVERRCKIDSVSANEAIKQDKCLLNNRQVVRISTTSLTAVSSVSDCRASNGADHGRRIAHSEWIRKKHEAAQHEKEKEEHAARKRQEMEEKIAQEKEERARLEKENFLKWMERKRQQELDRKAMLENELELQRRLKEIEDKAAVAKTLYLRQWSHKKRVEQKARHKEQEMRQRKMDEERERRLEQSSKAYEKWRENSKNKPKPATQGLLPHQKAKPAYVNPIPWQSIVEVDSENEIQENAFNDKKGNMNKLKISGGNTIAAHQ